MQTVFLSTLKDSVINIYRQGIFSTRMPHPLFQNNLCFQDNTTASFEAEIQETNEVKIEKNDVAYLLGKHNLVFKLSF